MLGLALILTVFLIGDALTRRFIPLYSLSHRLAAAFIVGSFFSSIVLYLGALFFSSTASPLFWANFLFFSGSVVVLFFTVWKRPGNDPNQDVIAKLWATVTGIVRHNRYAERPPGSDLIDRIVLGIFFLFTVFLVYSTLNFADGSFKFSVKAWSDFGANLSLSQSFALGNNVPTEHPFLSGEPIRYHFLFWFLAANISYLGVNLVTSINALSIISFISLVVLIMTLAEQLFENRWVGRLAGVFFFLSSSSLSYLAFFGNYDSVASAIAKIYELTDFVKGYPYRGDDWGSLTIAVFAYQRHLISAVAAFLLVIVYLIGIYKDVYGTRPVQQAATAVPPPLEPGESIPEDDQEPVADDVIEATETATAQTETFETDTPDDVIDTPAVEPITVEVVKPSLQGELPGLVLCGFLIGALPYWNSAVFVASAIVLVALLVLLPARKYTAIVFATAIAVALPQILYLQSGDKIDPQPALFYFGYIVPNPSLTAVLEYAGWLFGAKMALLLITLILSSGLHRRLLIAFTGLVFAVFIFQFSIDVFNNHKLLNVWSVLTSVFVAYAVVKIGEGAAWRKALAVVLALVVAGGSAIDLFPLKNDRFVDQKFEGDPLSIWILANTNPHDVFLSDRHLSHPILFSGRKLFMGNPLFPWAAGYNTPVREAKFREMLTERDPARLRETLRENNVAYVAFDDGLRTNGFVNKVNEDVFAANFEKVFTDTEKRYGNIAIFRVDQNAAGVFPPADAQNRNLPPASGSGLKSAFTGGPGQAPGEFKAPRGIAVGSNGQIYVADAGNARVQVFSATGEYVSNFRGFEFGEPNGIAVDKDGNVYVTDAAKHKLLKFSPEGEFRAEWPDTSKTTFYGPRGVAIAPNGLVYVVDQGNSRVVVIDPSSDRFTYWGKNGSAEGDFAEPGGIEIFDNTVYVIDTLNNRIQSFSLEGAFKASWAVPEWDAFPWQFPDIKADADRKRFYVTSPRRNEILVLGMDGQRLEPMSQPAQSALQSPAYLAIDKQKDKNRLYVVNNGGSNVSFYDLGSPPPAASPTKKS